MKAGLTREQYAFKPNLKKMVVAHGPEAMSTPPFVLTNNEIDSRRLAGRKAQRGTKR